MGFQFWLSAYKLKWATADDLTKAVALRQITEAEKSIILAS